MRAIFLQARNWLAYITKLPEMTVWLFFFCAEFFAMHFLELFDGIFTYFIAVLLLINLQLLVSKQFLRVDVSLQNDVVELCFYDVIVAWIGLISFLSDWSLTYFGTAASAVLVLKGMRIIEGTPWPKFGIIGLLDRDRKMQRFGSLAWYSHLLLSLPAGYFLFAAESGKIALILAIVTLFVISCRVGRDMQRGEQREQSLVLEIDFGRTYGIGELPEAARNDLGRIVQLTRDHGMNLEHVVQVYETLNNLSNHKREIALTMLRSQIR